MTNKNLIPYFMIVAISVSLMAIDLYLPAMPMMVDYFNTSSDVIQNSISAFQLGLVVSAVIYGPLSDSFGRRRILLTGFGIFLTSSVLLLLLSNLDNLLFMRFLQGCGAGAAAALAPAVISDCFSEKESSKIIAQMSIIIILTPAVAPVLGGYLTTYFGWQSCFMFIAFSTFAAFVFFLKLFPETNPVESRTQLKLSSLLSNYKGLLTNKKFLYYLLFHSLPTSGLWCYITVMPFAYIKSMGVPTEHFGYYVFVQVMFVSATSYLVKRLVARKSSEQLMSIGLKLLFIGSITATVAAILLPNNPIIATICALPYFLGIPFIFPTSMSKAMSYAAESRGTAASCIASLRQLFAFIGSLTAAMIPDTTLMPAIIFMIIVAGFSALVFYLARKESSCIAIESV